MDRAFRDPAVLDRPVGEVMSPPMPMVGIGETVTDVVEALDRAAVGAGARRRSPRRRAHPSDVLVVPRRTSGEQARRRLTSLPVGADTTAQFGDDRFETAPSTPARTPTRRPARSSRRSRLATTFAQDEVGKHRGYEYARTGNPTRVRARGAPRRRSRAPATASPSPAGWPPRTRCCAAASPATTW